MHRLRHCHVGAQTPSLLTEHRIVTREFQHAFPAVVGCQFHSLSGEYAVENCCALRGRRCGPGVETTPRDDRNPNQVSPKTLEAI